jgi:hypothetical protein
MSFSNDVHEPGPHDHSVNPPPLTPELEALSAMNLAHWNLNRDPDDVDNQVAWFEARRRWREVVREAMRDV